MSINLQQIKAKMDDLVAKITQWNKEYFEDNHPSVPDVVYDQFYKELEKLEREYPEFKVENSPTNLVGGKPNGNFVKHIHDKPMMSLAKAYTLEEVQKFINDTEKKLEGKNLSYSLEPKIDGLSIALHYNNGQLTQAVTRGDGVEGEIVTKNIMQIQSIPQVISFKEKIEIRGEVYMSKDTFHKLNKEFEAEGKKLFANPRNAASGTLRQINPKIVKQRNLDAILYDIVDASDYGFKSQEESLKWLKNQGFNINKYEFISSDLQEIFEEIENFGDRITTFDYECDGFVIKLNNIEYWDELGKTAKFPKYAIAFKYETLEAITDVVGVSSFVGRTGKISYVANLKPVELKQTIVKAATLHNYSFMEELNINIGDKVKIIKSGEIIPKIIELVEKKSIGVFPKVLNCPSCNSVLKEYEGIVDQFCVNKNCVEKKIRTLSHFASRGALNIVKLGETYVDIFYKNGYLTDFVSIFKLKDWREKILEDSSNKEITTIRGFKDKKIDGILESIEQARKYVKLHKVFFGLGIKYIGSQVAYLICQSIEKLGDLVTMDLNLLQNTDTIGPKVVESLKEFMSDEHNIQQILELDQILTYEKKANKSDKLAGLTFAITGKLSLPRDKMVEIIQLAGGNFASSITSSVNYLISNSEGSSKLDNAAKKGIKIISEAELNKMLNE
ncbi:NAD-dependent DNA ligase LigA [Mycoplasma corogypsi]|uniref:NAD-dependent DNA ligase LigA n=1 Tax=Mycoplasma corogypsi TaxID=2106 RepID=UPI003872C29D